MDFEIRFPNGEKVPFETLNAEAANLWNIGIARDEVEYVFPNNPSSPDIIYNEELSWYEVIGLSIMYPQVVDGNIQLQQTWANIRESMLNSQLDAGDIWGMEADKLVADVTRTIEFLKPYYELIDLWESKSYKPIRLKEG